MSICIIILKRNFTLITNIATNCMFPNFNIFKMCPKVALKVLFMDSPKKVEMFLNISNPHLTLMFMSKGKNGKFPDVRVLKFRAVRF